MKELEKKHLEAIEKHKEDIQWPVYSQVDSDEAAKSCALITQRHGEIQRLEGMIEVYNYFLSRVPEFAEIIVSIEELESEIEKMKNIDNALN